MQTNIPSLWLLKSDVNLLVHRPERGEQKYNISRFSSTKTEKDVLIHNMYINMYESTIFNTFTPGKILLWWIKPFMPKVGFWAIERKTQQNYRTTDD